MHLKTKYSFYFITPMHYKIFFQVKKNNHILCAVSKNSNFLNEIILYENNSWYKKLRTLKIKINKNVTDTIKGKRQQINHFLVGQ